MSELSIQLLGPPHVTIDGQEILFPRRKSLALLVYLAVAHEAQRRDTLATLLWPELSQSRGRGALRRELSSLRKAVGDAWLETVGDEVRLAQGAQIVVDVSQFLAESARLDLAAWQRAATRYRGDFLTGFTLADSPEFDDWQFFEAEELRHVYATTLQQIIDASAGQPTAALPYARRLQALDPLHEPAHRQLIRLYAQAGQQAAALRQYGLLQQVLEEELGAAPSPETVDLVERIRAGRIEALTTPPQENAIPPAAVSRADWGEAPSVIRFFGREPELARLDHWIMQDGCRLVAILGIGGVGKTALATRIATLLEHQFECLVWRSLRNAPRLEELLSDLIGVLSVEQHYDPAAGQEQQIGHLLDLLAARHILLVLDNAESLLEAGLAGHFRPGFEGYERLLARIGEGRHGSCLLLTSREKPAIVAALEGDTAPVRVLPVTSLSVPALRAMLADKGLTGTEEAWQSLHNAYSGNPLALKLLAETIRELFDGDIGAFLAEETLFFGGVDALLAEQFDRLSPLEQEIMVWLAVEREPVDARRLHTRFVHRPTRRNLLEALRALHRRSLLERSRAGFSQQNVVLEYVSARLIETVCREIMTAIEEDAYINRFGLVLAQTKAYLRQSQRRLLLEPVGRRLTTEIGRQELGDRLVEQMADLRRTLPGQPGYAGGNLLNLYLHLGFETARIDLAGLAVWQACLQGIELCDANLTGADLSGSIFTDLIGNVMSVDISPDGTRLAAAESSTYVRIWRLPDGAPLATCRGHTSWVYCVAFAPDGQTLASSSEDGSVRLWHAQTGQPLAHYAGHTGDVWSVCFSPDGAVLASGAIDNQLFLWPTVAADAGNVGVLRPLKALAGPAAHVMAVAFSPDGALLAAGTSDGSVTIWHVQEALTADTPRPIAQFTAHRAGLWSVAFSPDGRFLASGGEDNEARVWDVKQLCTDNVSPVMVLQGHTNWIRSVRFDPTGRVVATASEDHTIRLWSLAGAAPQAPGQPNMQDRPLAVLVGHTNKVTSLSFGPDGKPLTSGSDDQTVRLWELELTEEDSGETTGRAQYLRRIQGFQQRVRAVAFSGDSRRIVSSYGDGSVRVWQTPSSDVGGHLLWSRREFENEASSVCFSPDGMLVAGGSWDTTIRIWQADSGETERVLRGHTGDVWVVCFSPDGKCLASAGNDRQIQLWEVASGTLRKTLVGHAGIVTEMTFNHAGDLLASADWGPAVRLWNLADGHELFAIDVDENPLPILAFSPDDRYLLVGGHNISIDVWDIASGRRQNRVEIHESHAPTATLDGQGLLIATSSNDERIDLWSVEESQLLAAVGGSQGGQSALRTLQFSPDSRLLAGGGEDETVRVWDVEAALAGSTDPCVDVLRVDGPYARTDITGVTGVSAAQKEALRTLGAISHEPARSAATG